MSEGDAKKKYFRYFSVSCSQTSSCARKPLILQYRYTIYECMCQVSLGLKEDEEGRQAPNASRVIFSCTELSIFDTSRSTAPKLAPVPGSR